MKNEIVKINAPELQALAESKAEQIKKTFEPMAKMLAEFEKEYSELMKIPLSEMTLDLTQKYKRLRLDIGKVRTETGKLKDKQKEYIKLEDKAIMGVHNILVWAVKEKEDKLKERENYFETQEQQRLEALQLKRAEKLAVYIEDASERNLSGMDDDVWNAYFETKKKAWEDEQAAIKKAEEDQIEKLRMDGLRKSRENALRSYYQFVPETHPDFGELSNDEWDDFLAEMKTAKEDSDKEQEEQRKENERLKKETKERERLAKIDADKREKAEQERKAKENIERKKREEEKRKERAEYEAKLKTEREEKKRIEREEKAKRDNLESKLKAKEEAEQKAKEAEEKQLQFELNKGDSAKVKDLLSDLESLKTKYNFKSTKNKQMYNDTCCLIDKVIAHINK